MEPDDIFSTLYPAEKEDDTYAVPVSANINRSAFPVNTPLAMAYVPFQKFGNVFEPEVAFRTGTLFPELDKPFLGSGGIMR